MSNFDTNLGLYAHLGDPEGSQHTLDSIEASNLREDVLSACWHYPGLWLSCRELVEHIFGEGPFSYEQCVRINKIQTIALKLHRQHRLERTVIDGVLHYRVN